MLRNETHFMKSALTVLVVFSALGLSFGQNHLPAGEKLTVKDAVETAIRNNLQVKQAGLQADAANINLQQARANLLPDLNMDISHSSNAGRSIDPFTNSYINQKAQYANYFAGSNLVLFNGLSLQNAIKQNALAYDASNMELQQAKDNLTLNVILTYLQVLNSQDQLTQSMNQLELSRKQVERLEIMNKEGAINPAMLSDLQGQLANDELAIISNRSGLETNKLALAQLMNVPYRKEIVLEPLSLDNVPAEYGGDVEKIYQSAEAQLAQVKAVDLREKSAAKGVKVAQGRLYPTIALFGNFSTNYSSTGMKNNYLSTTPVATGDYVWSGATKLDVMRDQENFQSQKIGYADQLSNNYYTSFGIGLRIPILNSFRARNQVKLARLSLKNAEYIKETTRIQLKQQVEQSYLNMTAAYERYKKLAEQVNAFSSSFRSAEVRFNAGVITSVDYLATKNNLDRANINLIAARYEYVFRTKILDYLQGQLSF